jgi:hypothetical protein
MLPKDILNFSPGRPLGRTLAAVSLGGDKLRQCILLESGIKSAFGRNKADVEP